MIKSLFNTFMAFTVFMSPIVGFSQTSPATEVTIEMPAADTLIPVQIPDPENEGKNLNMYVEKVDEKVLLEFMPSNLYKNLSNESATQLALQAGKTIAAPVYAGLKKGVVGAGSVVGHTLKSFPTESAIFFIAVGGVMNLQTITNYGENPIALEQHLASITDPVAHLSFFSFMVANGAVSKSIGALSSSTTLRHFIPYLGMTAGMLTSSIVGELIADPDFGKCVKHLMTPKPVADRAKSCDVLYKNWVLSRKLLQYVPGLISMLASSAVGGAFEWGLHCVRAGRCGAALARGAAGQGSRALVIRGIAVGLTFVPGVGWTFRGGATLYKIANMAAFTVLDQWLFHPLIKWPFGNMTDGERPSKIATEISKNILTLKNKDWISNPNNFCKDSEERDCESDLAAQIKEFAENMAKWREFNLEHTTMKHHHWTQMLSTLTGMYTASQKFYGDFIMETDIRLEKDAKNPNFIHPLERTYPLWGMKLEGQEIKPGSFISNPSEIERILLTETIAKAIEYIDTLAGETPEERASYRGADVHFIKSLVAARELLGSPVADLNTKIVSGIKKLNVLLYPPTPLGASDRVLKYQNDLRAIIGKPTPLMIPGTGYLAIYEMRDENKKLHQGLPYQKITNGFSTPNPTDVFIYNMVCGKNPDQGEQLIDRLAKGFSWHMSSPRIAKNLTGPAYNFFCEQRAQAQPRGNFYDRKFSMNENGREVEYLGLLDYVKRNLDTRFIDPANPMFTADKPSNPKMFETWWLNYVQPQLKNKIHEMAVVYESEIVPEFLETLKSAPNSRWNHTGLENSVLRSSQQELKFYLVVLGELIQDLYTLRKGEVPKELYAAKATSPVGPKIDVRTGFGKIFPEREFDAIAEFTHRDSFNFNAVMKNYTCHGKLCGTKDLKNKIKNAGVDVPLKFQTELMAEFRKMILLFYQFDVKEIGGRKRLTSKLSQKDFEAPEERATAILASIGKDFQAWPKEANQTMRVKEGALLMTPNQTEIFETLKTQIISVFKETQMHGQIINAVNYEKMQSAEKALTGKCAPQTMMSNPTLAAACRKSTAQAQAAQGLEE